MKQSNAGIRWNPRVRQDKVRRLYEMDARGLVDEDLINEVGITLLVRCQSLLLLEGYGVACPQCSHVFKTGWQWAKRNEQMVIRCPNCQEWECTGQQYRESFCYDGLAAGNALAYFREYVEKYPHAFTHRARFLLIDRLIHQFHYAMKQNPETQGAAERHEYPHAINGCNLIEGSHDAVLAFLDGLTYGKVSDSEVQATKARWKETVDLMRRTRRPAR